MEAATVLGIDVGARNIRVSTIIGGHPEVVDIDIGKRFMKACITYDDERKYIGEVAERQADVNPENAISSVKNFFTAKYKPNKEVRNELAPFEKSGKDLAFSVRYKGKKEVINPVQVMAEYLLHIRKTITKDKDLALAQTIITVPATFTNLQREAMLNASKMAGFNEINLLNETTAAAIRYQATHDVQTALRRVLFIDFGAIRISCSIVKFNGQNITVKKYTCTKIGGNNFDDALVDHFAKIIDGKKLCQQKISKDPRALRRLRAACEKVKKDLSMVGEKGKSKMLVAPLFNNGSSFNCVLTRREFEEEICAEQYRLALSCVDRIIPKKVLDDVVLIGGSSRLPLFRSKILKMFEKCNTKMNVDESVSNGAAIYASWNAQDRERIKDLCCYGYEIRETIGKSTKSLLMIEPFKPQGHTETVDLKTSKSNVIKLDIREIPIGETILSELFQVTVDQTRLQITIDKNSTIKFKLEVKRWVEVSENPLQVTYVDEKNFQRICERIGLDEDSDDSEDSAASVLSISCPSAIGRTKQIVSDMSVSQLSDKIKQILERESSSTLMLEKAKKANDWIRALDGRPANPLELAKIISQLHYYEDDNIRSLSATKPTVQLASIINGVIKEGTENEQPKTNGHSIKGTDDVMTNGGTSSDTDGSDKGDKCRGEIRV